MDHKKLIKTYLEGIVELVEVPDNIKRKAFASVPNVDVGKYEMTNESLYSITGVRGSNFIADLIAKYYGSYNLVITDGTANIGSDAVTFGLKFNKTNAIELNEVNYKALVNNIKLSSLEHKITTYHGSSVKILPTLKQDVIYLDPPWGGKSYKKHHHLRLYLDSIELVDIFKKFRYNAKMFVFKVPLNYDLNNFLTGVILPVHVHNYIDTYGKVRFRILILWSVKDFNFLSCGDSELNRNAVTSS